MRFQKSSSFVLILILLLELVSIMFLFPIQEAEAANWYNSLWTYRKAITIDHDYVSLTTTTAAFPVLVSTTDSDLLSKALSNGHDILFTASDGTTKLDHELEEYTSGTGKLLAWVETAISSTTDTEIYMYYGNSGASDQQDIHGTWNDNFKGVWHMKDDTTSSTSDSTANYNHGLKKDANEPFGMSTSTIDGGQDFDGTDDYINCGNDPSLWPAKASLFMWVNPASVSQGEMVLKNDISYFFVLVPSAGQLEAQANLNIDGTWRGRWTAIQKINKDEWSYIGFTYDAVNIKMYVNGEPKGTFIPSPNGDLATGSLGNLHIARRGSGVYFNGAIDEVRISNTARSAEWIKTSYNNQDSPSTFYGIGNQERVSGPEMASDSYRIWSSSINVGGNQQTSNNYKMRDTIGEFGVGISTSTSYKLKAGYQQMQEVYISISAPDDVTMSPNIGGITGGASDGEAVWTVTTDSPSGYTLSIHASESPALTTSTYSFADYTLFPDGIPTYNWGVSSTDSEFGFTPYGADTVVKYQYTGGNCNNSGTADNSHCWYNFSTSPEDIAKTTSSNHPSGTGTTVKFKAESGASHIQELGFYTATITATALPN